MTESAVKLNSILEIVIMLESGPDSLGRYTFTMFWLDTYNPSMKVSQRRDGLFRRAQVFFADPYQEIHGKRGKQVRIVDLTGNWKGKLVYP